MISGNCSASEINECVEKEGRIRAECFLRKPVSIVDLRECFGVVN